MSIADSGNGGLSAADIAAVMGGANGNGPGWGGDGAWWLLVLFLFAMNGGWGNGAGNNPGMIYPWMMNQGINSDVQRGFDQSAIMSMLNSISNQANNGFANAEISRCNSQANILQTLNNNQAANSAAMNSLAMALQNCCCENRAATADLKYTVATEACSDRAAVTSALNELKTFTASGFQSINDKLCQLEIDGIKQNYENRIAGMQQRYDNVIAENTSLKFDRSQAAQDIFVQNLINGAVNKVNPTPIPAYTVQNPNCCSQLFNTGCGCSAA